MPSQWFCMIAGRGAAHKHRPTREVGRPWRDLKRGKLFFPKEEKADKEPWRLKPQGPAGFHRPPAEVADQELRFSGDIWLF